MVWLVVVALGLWVFFQQNRLVELSRQLASLEVRLARLLAVREAEGRTEQAAATAPSPRPNVAAPVVAAPMVSVPEPVMQASARGPEPIVQPIAAPEPALAVDAAPIQASLGAFKARTSLSGRSVSDWLSENGLAWIGGGAFAIGGLLLVAYAAQRGLFTPGLRIISALVLGVCAVAGGEWLRRGARSQAANDVLVASLTTAAGAAILYAAIWAANVLYGFISLAAAAGLLAGISVGLLGLALLHGEAIGVLAIVAAYAVPAISGSQPWSGPSLDAFILLILFTGLAAAGLRRWGGASGVTLAGAMIWTLARAIDRDGIEPILVGDAGPLLVMAMMMLFPPGRSDAEGSVSFKWMPYGTSAWIAVIAFSLTTLAGLRFGLADLHPVGPGVIAAGMALAVAIGLRRHWVSPLALLAPAALLAVTALGGREGSFAAPALMWLTPAIGALAAAGFDGALHGERRPLAAVIGAAGAALALTMAGPVLADTLRQGGVGVDLGFVILFSLAAWGLARQSPAAESDLALGAFVAAASDAAGLALHIAAPATGAPMAYGLLGLVLAALAVRIRWRGVAESAAVASFASLAVMFGGAVAGAAFAGKAAWSQIGLITVSAAGVQAAAWWVLRRRPAVVTCIEAISTSAVLTGLIGAFLSLQAWSAAREVIAGSTNDQFALASLRTVLLLAAGLILIIRGGTTPLGRSRGPILLCLGLIHGLLLEGLVFHPWWGFGAAVGGPPLIDGVLLGLFAPAALSAAAARHLAPRSTNLATLAAWGALAFVLVWLATEIRRLFHGPVLGQGAFGYAEVGAYALAFLACGAGAEAAHRRFEARLQSFSAVRTALDSMVWSALSISVLVFGDIASPWWGPLQGDLTTPMLLGLFYVCVCLITAGLAYGARVSGRAGLAQVALATAGVELFALLSLIVRYGFHGGAMRAPLREASVETWTFSAVWALYGLVVLAIGAGRRDLALRWLGLAILLATTAKVFLFDLSRLEGIIRAASFLALGAVLLVGALAARRFARSEPASASSGPG